jgi:hypothetical protein
MTGGFGLGAENAGLMDWSAAARRRGLHSTSTRLMRCSSATFLMRVAHRVSPKVTRESALVNKTIANATSRRSRTCAFAHHHGRRRPTEPQSNSSALKTLQPEIAELRHH